MSEFQTMINSGAQQAWKKTKRAGLLALLAAILAGGVYLWVCSWTYSDGSRAGYLVKVTRKGVVFKTYEGQLNLGGIQTTPQGGLSGNLWDFSMSNREVYESLSNLEGKQVKLLYKERYKVFFWQGDTPYFVYKVQPLE